MIRTWVVLVLICVSLWLDYGWTRLVRVANERTQQALVSVQQARIQAELITLRREELELVLCELAEAAPVWWLRSKTTQPGLISQECRCGG